MNAISFAAAALLFSMIARGADVPFRAQDVDTKVEIGYGLAIADVNGDGQKDILLADKNLITWYENPSWNKHVIAEKLTTLDHVCIAAADIDGDGKAEVAAGAGWNPSDTVNSGALFYLQAGNDRTQKWHPVALHHEPTIHRIRWARGADGKFGLISVPLHGRGNKGGEGDGVKQMIYRNFLDKSEPEVIDQSLHMTHNFDVVQWDRDEANEILIAGKEGIFLFDPAANKQWTKKQLAGTGQAEFVGSGEVRLGKLNGGARYLAAVEPMHGNNVVIYREPKDASGLWTREVLANDLVDGHAVATGDFLGKGHDQFAVGWRGRRPGDSIGVRLYTNVEGKWQPTMIDDKGMACEDLAAADLNGDGKLDLIAAGRATKNVKVYWNERK